MCYIFVFLRNPVHFCKLYLWGNDIFPFKFITGDYNNNSLWSVKNRKNQRGYIVRKTVEMNKVLIVPLKPQGFLGAMTTE